VDDLYEETCSFTSFQDALKNSVEAQIVLGYYFPFTLGDSVEGGEQIGGYVVENCLAQVHS
jgi:hypothetical protein